MMSLEQTKTGSEVKVISITLPENILGRLLDLGILPGTTLEIVSPSLYGASVVACRGNRIAMDRRLTRFIEVSEI